MSGIAGVVRRHPSGITVDSLGRMAAAIKHRGPDGYGFFAGHKVGLAHVSLSTRERGGGAQPLVTEDTLVLVADGEIFNHLELRRELEERGHVFYTHSHDEVLLHGYEEWGPSLLLQMLDGQFAFAMYDKKRQTVLVARDRFGMRPLFFAQRNGDFYFASEVKAILATGEVEASLDPRGLDEVLRMGAGGAPRTPFSGVASLVPGTYGIWQNGGLLIRHYYELDYPEAPFEPPDVIEKLDEIMLRSVGRRLRADVPVGAYVSGGLYSAVTAHLAKRASQQPLHSFSITYAIPEFDDSLRQSALAAHLGYEHKASAIGMDTIAQTFPSVVWHAETPLLKTDPALMYHLAKVTRESGLKVVVGGEGADEIFLGNDLFKESAVRRFCLRYPDPARRRRLLERIYSGVDLGVSEQQSWNHLLELGAPTDPLFSHLPRFFRSGIGEFYATDFKSELIGNDVISELRASLPTRFFAWSPLNQAAYLEMTTHLSSYVLNSHGDRMASAHGVEARYPFLDHRVFEFASALPTGSPLRGLHGKQVLRRWASRILPPQADVAPAAGQRPPEAQCFLLPTAPSWIGDHLTPEAIRRVGIFSAAAVGGLLRRFSAGASPGVGENQALIGVLSTQLWYDQFVESAIHFPPLPVNDATVILGETVGVGSLPNLNAATQTEAKI